MDQFVERSKRERYSLNKIKPFLTNGQSEVQFHTTDEYSYDKYDAIINFLDQGKTIKQHIIEFKHRDTHYDILVLETKKFKSLKRHIMRPEITDLIYICSTPKATYLFNLSEMEKSGKLPVVKMNMNKATSESRSDKVQKTAIMLNIEDAYMVLYYTFNEQEYLNSLVKDKKEENKKGNSLF